MARKLSPVHPGEVLLEEFLRPMSISQYQLAKDISVPPAGSTRSSSASVQSLRIRPCACPGTSGPLSASG